MAALYEIEKLSLELVLSSLEEADIVKEYELTCQHICTAAALQYCAEAFVHSFHMLRKRYLLEGLDPVQFGQKAIRICLKLSREHDYLYTEVACAFLKHNIALLAKDRNCFKFTYVAWKCLIVILKKRLCLGNGREVMARWRELQTHVRALFARVLTRKETTVLEAICFDDYIEMRCTLTIVDDCFVVLEEQYDLSREDAAFIASYDIPERERVNYENLRICDFCHQTCEMYIHYFVKKLESDYAADYTILI